MHNIEEVPSGEREAVDEVGMGPRERGKQIHVGVGAKLQVTNLHPHSQNSKLGLNGNGKCLF
ncbi:hypothetical protein Csa_011334 [Cucumis sativus]|uniref:Uncharacterized protein n=1 Tax=Cucumis sativus TaxID=3659 RepID=A0A0A0L561_CUCSA|nr:hypothetical protein Csa_011334 [Cucumis sativus]